MHLGNGIICPVTGIPMIALAVGSAVYSYRKAKQDFTKEKILPTAVLTILVFALQMLNFAIPYTSSSGHIIGAMLLAIILGPYIGFLSISTVILIQALFFADGGLMEFGCNVFNMGFLACFVVYPYVFKFFENRNKFIAILTSSIIALQLGSIALEIELVLSGALTSNVIYFSSLMQMIHLPIGIVEGIATSGICLLYKKIKIKNFSYIFAALSVILAGFIAKYASTKPDGLEWSMLKLSDSIVIQTQGVLYDIASSIQTKLMLSSNILGLLIAGLVIYIACLMMSKKAKA